MIPNYLKPNRVSDFVVNVYVTVLIRLWENSNAKPWYRRDFFNFQIFIVFVSSKIDFSINLNKCFWAVINTSKVMLCQNFDATWNRFLAWRCNVVISGILFDIFLYPHNLLLPKSEGILSSMDMKNSFFKWEIHGVI